MPGLLTKISDKTKTESKYWIRRNKQSEQVTCDLAAQLKSKMSARAADLTDISCSTTPK